MNQTMRPSDIIARYKSALENIVRYYETGGDHPQQHAMFSEAVTALHHADAATPSAVSREDEWPEKESVPSEIRDIIEHADEITHNGGSPLKAIYAIVLNQMQNPLSPAQPGYSEQQVREAVRLARSSNPDGIGGYTPDEIISLLNKK